jgi:hypothetical protein
MMGFMPSECIHRYRRRSRGRRRGIGSVQRGGWWRGGVRLRVSSCRQHPPWPSLVCPGEWWGINRGWGCPRRWRTGCQRFHRFCWWSEHKSRRSCCSSRRIDRGNCRDHWLHSLRMEKGVPLLLIGWCSYGLVSSTVGLVSSIDESIAQRIIMISIKAAILK